MTEDQVDQILRAVHGFRVNAPVAKTMRKTWANSALTNVDFSEAMSIAQQLRDLGQTRPVDFIEAHKRRRRPANPVAEIRASHDWLQQGEAS